MSKSRFCNTKNMHTVFNLKPTAEKDSSVSKEGTVPLLDEQIFSPRVFPVNWGQAGTDLRAALLRLLGATSQGKGFVLRVPEEWPLVGGCQQAPFGAPKVPQRRERIYCQYPTTQSFRAFKHWVDLWATQGHIWVRAQRELPAPMPVLGHFHFL